MNPRYIEARERLQHMALHDSLTGLANGRRFNPYMDEALARSRRHDLPGALLYFDLDGFKKVNDTLGHKFGDYLLQELAERLRNGLRETDLIARLGGDEFAIVLENLKISGSPYDVGNKILEIVSESFHDQGQEATVGASIGIAPFSPNSRNGDELVKQADTAMYRAKNTGKGRICVYDPTIDIIQ